MSSNCVKLHTILVEAKLRSLWHAQGCTYPALHWPQSLRGLSAVNVSELGKNLWPGHVHWWLGSSVKIGRMTHSRTSMVSLKRWLAISQMLVCWQQALGRRLNRVWWWRPALWMQHWSLLRHSLALIPERVWSFCVCMKSSSRWSWLRRGLFNWKLSCGLTRSSNLVVMHGPSGGHIRNMLWNEKWYDMIWWYDAG